MISQNPYSNCMSARLYYYDFLNEETGESIPESTMNHIVNCPDCQTEVHRLETLLANADKRLDDQQSRRASAITTLLKFHFSYVGEPVTCNTVKPFLASLADPVLRLLIPTPITRHIDECRDCREDLLAVQELHLTHKQLCRLGQFLAEQPIENTVNCSQAREAIPAVASMVFQETSAEILKHLSTCSECRKRLFQHREELRSKLSGSAMEQGKIPCKEVTSSDIYDYAFPYRIDPADDEYIEFREPLASHVGGCPICLEKVQELQKTIYNIAERPESEVVTVYHVDEPVADLERPVETINFTARLKRAVSLPKVKPLLGLSTAAAAVILIGLTFMFSGPTVEAVPWDPIRTAINEAGNLHIATFGPDQVEPPTQEQWVSQSLGSYMFKDLKEIILCDVTNKLRKIRQLDTNETKTIEDLPDDVVADIRGNLAGVLNIFPQISISDKQKELTWDHVTEDDLAMGNEKDEVYDLVWTNTSSIDSSRNLRRRYFVDPQTNLPKRIEFSQKSSENDEYTLISIRIVKKITDREMQDEVDSAFP